jgi:hypothetical protein
MLPDNSIMNVVSDHDLLPDLRALWNLWITTCLRPRFVYYYLKMADIPIRTINTRQRALLGLASVNLEIASHPWRFETTNLRRLRQMGLEFPETTLETIALCQRRFIEESPKLKEFLEQNKESMADIIQYFQVDGDEASAFALP